MTKSSKIYSGVARTNQPSNVDSDNDTNSTKKRKIKDYQIKIRDHNFTE